ncbi:hypothetical protein BOTBODRAFT_133608 [Botryobasidium botryosum FD-172 SS1]|uniref:non-chaperonin molecular chaperone ATPase n=1 Tax=Botryobasidium botryosum (strain FD-172 SS1) TaxID=930990 RepID=A0A067MC97_BOTB1|nr:hypothetical protein BOTBODRAFT_133608 [Botryobasidium botryosum FD-172 SS1]
MTWYSGASLSRTHCGPLLLCLRLAFAFHILAPAIASNSKYGTVVGIDFGTTHSRVSVYRNGRTELIPNEQGHHSTPSWVSFTKDERRVGEQAKNALDSDLEPENGIFDVKCIVGRKVSKSKGGLGLQVLHDARKHWPFKVSEGIDGQPLIRVNHKGRTKHFTPEELSAIVLRKLKENAEAYLGEKVTHAVVTVPAHFSYAQRQAVRTAGAIAGLTVVRTMNEPSAAALAHYHLNPQKGERHVVVCNLGGGTFDVSLFSVEDGVFEVLATAGHPAFGGRDFDNRLMDYFIKLYGRNTGTDVGSNHRALRKLRHAVENAKHILSSQMSTTLEIDNFENGNNFVGTLTRNTFEELNGDLFLRVFGPLKQVLEKAGVKKDQIHDIVLVGGSTRIPRVRRLLKRFFGKEPVGGVDPDQTAAYGAAIQAAILNGEEGTGDIVVVDVCPFTLGVRTADGVFSELIPQNAAIPTKKSQTLTTGTKRLPILWELIMDYMNPDERKKEAEAETKLKKMEVFEGEHSRPQNHLGTINTIDILPVPHDTSTVDVTFDMDANGILNVWATCKETGKTASIAFTKENSPASQVKIKHMAKALEKFVADDEETSSQRVQREALRNFQDYIWDFKQQLDDPDGLGGELPTRTKNILLEALQGVTEWLEVHGQSATVEKLAEVRALIGAIPLSSRKEGVKRHSDEL